MVKYLLPLLLSSCYMAPATAQTDCFRREEMIERLGDIGQHRKVMLLTRNEQLIEVFVNEDNGDWIMVTTFPTMVSCIRDFGTMWVIVDDPQGELN